MKQPDSDIQFEAEKSAIAMPEAGETETEQENRPPHPQDVNEIGE